MSVDPSRAIERAIGVTKLDIPTFEEVEADESATIEAGVVLAVSTVIGSLGLLRGGLGSFIVSLIVLLLGWFVWAWVSAEIAKRLFSVRTTDVGEMLRVIGYASAPRALAFLTFIPLLGWLIGLAVFVWTLVTVVIGIRQAGEMTTTQAAITAFLGWIPTVIAVGIVAAIL